MIRVIPIKKKNLRFFDFIYDHKYKELHVALWFWLIIFYRDDVK